MDNPLKYKHYKFDDTKLSYHDIYTFLKYIRQMGHKTTQIYNVFTIHIDTELDNPLTDSGVSLQEILDHYKVTLEECEYPRGESTGGLQTNGG